MTPESSAGLPVIVIGGGLSGVACARRLHDAGMPVRVLERSHRLGGRMAVRTEQLNGAAHAVDIGAPYFTVRDGRFAEVVNHWAAAGHADGWTDTFLLATPDGRIGATTSPLRWSATKGMRSLVEVLAEGLDVRLRHEAQEVRVRPDGASGGVDDVLAVDGESAVAVVLAMPDPQADRLLTSELAAQLEVAGRAWVPALCVWSAWRERWWPDFDAVFVDGSKVLAWVSDDGRSRGDEAAVLVAHTTGDYAAGHLDDVDGAASAVLAELPRVLNTGHLPQPLWTRVHRWSLASSKHPHAEQFKLVPAVPGRRPMIGVCGDGWGERSRVEQAWLSGDHLASALLESLTVSS